jgi:4-amino-4-deoxy-L-arabinose transferase-like glycosyltransferase
VPSSRPRWAPLAVVVAAAWLRILFNDVTQFSRADETQYLLVTQRLLRDGYFAGYPALARDHIANPAGWPFPTPLRCGYFAITTLVSRVAGECNYSTLTWLSTASGVVAVAFAWALGRRLVGERAAVVGALFVAVSPLQLAMSRRALQDETTCAVSLVAIWAFVRLLEENDRRRARRWCVAALLLTTLAIAVKETFVFYAPGFALLLWRLRRDRGGVRMLDLVPALAPAVFATWYALLAGGLGAFVDMARCVLESLHHEYATQYYGGAPHRNVVDLVALCAPTTLLAIAATGALLDRTAPEVRGARRLAAFIGASLVLFSLRLQVLRFVVGIDALACLLAAWLVVHATSRATRSTLWLGASVTIVVAADLALFQRVFLTGAVYDPTSVDVLRALDMIPR